MTGGPLRARGSLVDALSSALDRGGHGLSNAPTLLRRLLQEGGWQEFETSRGEVVQHARFADFIVTPPLKGLGTNVDLVRRIVKDDVETLDLLDQALQNPAHIHADVNVINVDRPQGTSQEQALRRLRKDAPELHAEVLAGRLSAHAAMVKAGFRPKTFTIRGDRPDSIVKTLRKNLSPEQLSELRRLLDE